MKTTLVILDHFHGPAVGRVLRPAGGIHPAAGGACSMIAAALFLLLIGAVLQSARHDYEDHHQ